MSVQNTTSMNGFNPHTEFMSIHDKPYNEVTYNCLNKSVDFANYLKEYNQTNVSYVNIAYKTGDYSHQFVIWNSECYDPTSGAYDVNETTYINYLESKGFTGIIFTSPA